MTDVGTLFILQETSAGYGIYEITSFDEIGTLATSDTVTDPSRFGRFVKLKAFQAFDTAKDALENANAISEHAMTAQLKEFLEMNLPKPSSSTADKTFALGVVDPGLATAIADGCGYPMRSDDAVRELDRGCRLHIRTFVKGLDKGGLEQSQLGLGHSYSRSKVKFNPARSDNMIIQSIALLDQMDKDLNTFAMRVREWYSWHFPELKGLVKDNYMFARSAAFIQDKSSLCAKKDDDEEETEDKLPGLVDIVGDEDVAKAVVQAAKTSMGMECSAVDMVNIINFTQRMVKLAEYRKQLAGYLSDKMSIVAPNLAALIGDKVGARLISKAGSLTNLAKAPASTVQILGAEKALFRALKTKGNTPKYGLIYHSTFIGRADAKNKGRISRYLANKCSIATRIDFFLDGPNSAYGKKLRDQVKERLQFYQTGKSPRKNIDVMMEVSKQLKAAKGEDVDDASMDEVKEKKKDKKSKKRKSLDVDDDEDMEDVAKEEKSKKSAKKSAKKSKKERKDKDAEEITETPKKAPKSEAKSSKKKKKKKAKE
mmetsp:Transcript_5933/g.7243  ORF Transcript_5933/g.7243 Transcript_5933/m.7243 type:complete len:541 (+) Transcript_5933:146-1768(+)